MIIDLPNDHAVDSKSIASVRWHASHEERGTTYQASVVVEKGGGGFFGGSWMSFPCASDDEAQELARRVIAEWKQGAEAQAA